jgi:hypothetical protein
MIGNILSGSVGQVVEKSLWRHISEFAVNSNPLIASYAAFN